MEGDFIQGALSGTFSPDSDTGKYVSKDASLTGEVNDINPLGLIVGTIDGETTGVSPGSVKGVLRGVDGSFMGHVATVFVGENGDVGYITGNQSGDMSNGNLSALGTLTRTIVETGTNADIDDFADSNYRIPILGTIPFGNIDQTTINMSPVSYTHLTLPTTPYV